MPWHVRVHLSSRLKVYLKVNPRLPKGSGYHPPLRIFSQAAKMLVSATKLQ